MLRPRERGAGLTLDNKASVGLVHEGDESGIGDERTVDGRCCLLASFKQLARLRAVWYKTQTAESVATSRRCAGGPVVNLSLIVLCTDVCMRACLEG